MHILPELLPSILTFVYYSLPDKSQIVKLRRVSKQWRQCLSQIWKHVFAYHQWTVASPSLELEWHRRMSMKIIYLEDITKKLGYNKHGRCHWHICSNLLCLWKSGASSIRFYSLPSYQYKSKLCLGKTQTIVTKGNYLAAITMSTIVVYRWVNHAFDLVWSVGVKVRYIDTPFLAIWGNYLMAHITVDYQIYELETGIRIDRVTESRINNYNNTGINADCGVFFESAPEGALLTTINLKTQATTSVPIATQAFSNSILCDDHPLLLLHPPDGIYVYHLNGTLVWKRLRTEYEDVVDLGSGFLLIRPALKTRGIMIVKEQERESWLIDWWTGDVVKSNFLPSIIHTVKAVGQQIALLSG